MFFFYFVMLLPLVSLRGEIKPKNNKSLFFFEILLQKLIVKCLAYWTHTHTHLYYDMKRNRCLGLFRRRLLTTCKNLKWNNFSFLCCILTMYFALSISLFYFILGDLKFFLPSFKRKWKFAQSFLTLFYF